MKTKDIIKATQPGNHYDHVAIFRLEHRYGNWKMLRIMTPNEKPLLQHGWQHRNKNQQSYISVVYVEPIDANDMPQGYGDTTFVCAGVRDKVNSVTGEVITDTVHVSRIECQMNDAESIVTIYNDMLERRGHAEEIETQRREAARQAAEAVLVERKQNEQRIANLAERIITVCGGSLSTVTYSHSGAVNEVTISLNKLEELVAAAEAARKLNIVA
jgi:hypothetical protein